MNKLPASLFFDLDGTLFDTAQDLYAAMSELLLSHHLTPMPFTEFRYHISGGTKTMLCEGFNIDEHHPDYSALRADFLTIYEHNLTTRTTLFAGMEQVLDYLDQHAIPWGIVTNKPGWLAQPIIAHFQLHHRCQALVAGDTLEETKPSPKPLLHACALIQVDPKQSIYIGDTETDIIAARAAGMLAIAVQYGYHQHGKQPSQWNADVVIQSPIEIIDWLSTSC